jgi:hypothetical protein
MMGPSACPACLPASLPLLVWYIDLHMVYSLVYALRKTQYQDQAGMFKSPKSKPTLLPTYLPTHLPMVASCHIITTITILGGQKLSSTPDQYPLYLLHLWHEQVAAQEEHKSMNCMLVFQQMRRDDLSFHLWRSSSQPTNNSLLLLLLLLLLVLNRFPSVFNDL